MIEFSPAVSGEGSELVNALTPTTICSPRSIASSRRVLDSTSFAFSTPRLDRLDRAAHRVDGGEFRDRLALQLGDQRCDLLAAVENVAEFQEVGLVGHDLLQAQRPLLVEGPRQAERLVPGRQLHGAGSRVLRQDHRQHLNEDAIGVVLRLLLGQSERIDLNAVAEAALGRILRRRSDRG